MSKDGEGFRPIGEIACDLVEKIARQRSNAPGRERQPKENGDDRNHTRDVDGVQ